MTTVYISIGNSDDKLTQADWAQFCTDVSSLDYIFELTRHGNWYSNTASRFQNACFCFEIDDDDDLPAIKDCLVALSMKYNQESIAFAIAKVEFLTP